MKIQDYSTKELIEELKRREFEAIFLKQEDTFKINIINSESQNGCIGHFQEGNGAVAILVIKA